MDRKLECRCGSMHWQVDPAARGTRIACYCASCRDYALAQGDADLLDAQGGTELFQTLPGACEITKGAAHLKVRKLSAKGPWRWYAGCCGTPVANTLGNMKMPFAGFILPLGRDDFGPMRARVNTDAVKDDVRGYGLGKAVFAILRRAMGARLRRVRNGGPFFDESGQPRVALDPRPQSEATETA